jgi:hypothetical protein
MDPTLKNRKRKKQELKLEFLLASFNAPSVF